MRPTPKPKKPPALFQLFLNSFVYLLMLAILLWSGYEISEEPSRFEWLGLFGVFLTPPVIFVIYFFDRNREKKKMNEDYSLDD